MMTAPPDNTDARGSSDGKDDTKSPFDKTVWLIVIINLTN